MEQYINKSDLLTKIEKRLHKYEKEYEELAHYEVWITAKEIEHRIQGLKEALSILNALEVKDVNLEEEFNDFLDNVEGVPPMWHSDEQIEWAKYIARHFFELGLKARKEEVK